MHSPTVSASIQNNIQYDRLDYVFRYVLKMLYKINLIHDLSMRHI